MFDDPDGLFTIQRPEGNFLRGDGIVFYTDKKVVIGTPAESVVAQVLIQGGFAGC